ncbi:SDR family NAD(P)-dependent oxidoreductase [Gemmobacter denitrificans]|uniref:SDR family NAD(P)-dependent oxidoreductase n=1 Tax=Gemmobacter denitrificans TaxID=3123040 RepID=A0ABU8BV63_9RHOB
MVHVLITGGARGIGRALCEAALARGWQVSCTLRQGEPPPRVTGYRLEMVGLAGLADLAADIGPIDILIHNAGIIGPKAGPLGDLNPDDFARVMQVNAFAPLAITRALLPQMQAGGRVLAISSQMAWMGYAKSDSIAYRMSKVALNKGVQAMATDLAPRGMIAVAIDPGWVRTDMGGAEADRDPAAAGAEIIALADRLTPGQNGRFLKSDGTERDW